MEQRIEEDSIGKIKIQNDRLYGINTQRAVNNFHLTVNKTNIELIKQMAKIKYAAAIANEKVGRISHETSQAIKEAAEEIIAGDLNDEFVVPEIQGGAGTSTNMNVNEVIANRGLNILGYDSGDYEHLSPQDDVNAGQSTNDVYPSSGKLAILEKSKSLDEALDHMIEALDKKADEFAKIKKIGRTQLQEAVPTTLGNTFKAYSNSMKRCKQQLNKSMNELWELNLGGTAIGTGVNAAKGYKEYLYTELRKLYNVNVHPASDLIDSTQNLDTYVRVSGSLKALAVSISKMSHDLRLLSSGPRSGFNEINLPARQAESSIMPGKVNPVIPEIASQISFQIIGNDTTITLASESGELELNAFEPVIFHNIFESEELMKNACYMLSDECISGIEANKEKCDDDVSNSVESITELTPIIGYATASRIVHESIDTGVDVYELLKQQHIYDPEMAETSKAN